MRSIEVGMSRRIVTSIMLTYLLVLAGCRHNVQNPMANINSKQPDKALYDRAIDSMKHGRFQESRSLLETLINAYPDSEYIARAKLAVGDSWYSEGGKTAWQQAEVEYKDFQTFFPNMPESAEAQLKIANMHYQQMEKADRDYGEALHAADEYRALIQHYPDSQMVPQAKQRLREVQEDLAERQYGIAQFYYLRNNLAAAQARLQSLIDSYPLYSQIDDALFDLGQLYEKEAWAMRRQQSVPAGRREAIGAEFQKHAIEAYSRIITRYPAKPRAKDARHRLEALNAPVPKPTREALAESKAEEQSRHNISMTAKVIGNFRKHPNLARAPGVGEPSMNDEEVRSAVEMLKDLNQELKLGMEPVASGTGAPPASQPPPSSSAATTSSSSGAPGAASPAPGSATPAASDPATAAPTSSVPSSNNSAGPAPTTTSGGSASQTAEGTPPPAAPAQVNEVAQNSSANQQASSDQSGSSTQDSSSKKKTKKGLRKIIPF